MNNPETPKRIDETILIKCEDTIDAETAIKEIKEKIKPSCIGILVSSLYAAKSNNKLGLLKMPNKEEADKMIKEISKLNLPIKAELSPKLKPSIIIFGFQNPNGEEDIKEAVIKVIGKEPSFISLNTTSKTAIIRFEKEDYYKFISASPHRLNCDYTCYQYERHIPV